MTKIWQKVLEKLYFFLTSEVPAVTPLQSGSQHYHDNDGRLFQFYIKACAHVNDKKICFCCFHCNEHNKKVFRNLRNHSSTGRDRSSNRRPYKQDYSSRGIR